MSNDKTLYFKSCLGVFQGGGCRAAAFVGAYEVAIESGVTFVELAGTSAGSIVSCLIAAGATPAQLKVMLSELDFGKLLAPRETKGNMLHSLASNLANIFGSTAANMVKIHLYEGLYSSQGIEAWVENHLRKLLSIPPNKTVRFCDLPIPLWIVATDINERQVKIWDSRNTPNESVAFAVRASCSIPLFFQPLQDRYYDGGILSNLPAFVFAGGQNYDRPIASRALAFALKGAEEVGENLKRPLKRLVDTIVDGSEHLQLSMQANVPLIEIYTGEVRATDFLKMTPAVVTGLIANGRSAATDFFAEERRHVRIQYGMHSGIRDLDTFLTSISQRAGTCNSLIISETDTKFVYSIFPTLLSLRLKGRSISVILPQAPLRTSEHEFYQHSLLFALGCQVKYSNEIVYSAYIFDQEEAQSATAFVKFDAASRPDDLVGIRYDAPYHGTVIAALYQAMLHLLSSCSISAGAPSIIAISENVVIDRLRTVSQYRAEKVRMSFQRIPLDNLVSLTRLGREFKLHNIQFLYEAFKIAGLEPFSPASVRLFGGESIITPPVVEKIGNKLILIEGTTRAIYSRQNGIDRLPCVVVENVDATLPANTFDFQHVRIAGRTIETSDRYNKFEYASFRHIEAAMHKVKDIKND